MRRLLVIGALGLLAAMTLVACGSDETADQAATTTSPTSTEPGESTVPTSENAAVQSYCDDVSHIGNEPLGSAKDLEEFAKNVADLVDRAAKLAEEVGDDPTALKQLQACQQQLSESQK